MIITLKKGDVVNFENNDRILNASVEVVTGKAILIKWVFDGDRNSERWIPKSVITEMNKNRRGKGFMLSVSEWFWKSST